MKAIKLGCKTAGRPFGAIVEIGDDKKQISLDVAESLVEDGLATEFKETIVSGNTDQDLIDEIESLEDRVETLKAQLEEAINLPKGQKPDGYKKA